MNTASRDSAAYRLAKRAERFWFTRLPRSRISPRLRRRAYIPQRSPARNTGQYHTARRADEGRMPMRRFHFSIDFWRWVSALPLRTNTRGVILRMTCLWLSRRRNISPDNNIVAGRKSRAKPTYIAIIFHTYFTSAFHDCLWLSPTLPASSWYILHFLVITARTACFLFDMKINTFFATVLAH